MEKIKQIVNSLMLGGIVVNKLLYEFTRFSMLCFIDRNVSKINNFLIFSISFIITVNNMTDDNLISLCANDNTSINVF